MPLEDLTGNKYINALISSNPESGDDRYEGDNHMRGIKNVLKKSFPQINGPVLANPAELNTLDGITVSTSVESRLSGLESHEQNASIHFDDVSAPGEYVRTTTGWKVASGGGSTTLQLNTAGHTSDILLDLVNYYDGGDNWVENERMTYQVLGSQEGHLIRVRINGVLYPHPIARVGRNGQALGWLSAYGIHNEMISQGVPGWSDPDYGGVPKQVEVVLVDEDSQGGQVDIGSKSPKIRKAQITAPTIDLQPRITREFLHHSQVDFNVQYVAAGYMTYRSSCMFIGRNYGAGLAVWAVNRSNPTGEKVQLTNTDADGHFIGEIDAGWFYSWGYGNGSTGTMDIYMGGDSTTGQLIMSIPYKFNRTLVG